MRIVRGGLILKQFEDDDRYFMAKDKGFGTFVRELPVKLTKKQIVAILEQGGYENLEEKNHTIADLKKRLVNTHTSDHNSGNVNVPVMPRRPRKKK